MEEIAMKNLILVATILAATLTACADKDSDSKPAKKDGIKAAGQKTTADFQADLQNGPWNGSCQKVLDPSFNPTMSAFYVPAPSTVSTRTEITFNTETMVVSKVQYALAGCSGDVLKSELVGMFMYEAVSADNAGAVLSLYDVKEEQVGSHGTRMVKGLAQGRFDISIADELLTINAKSSPRSAGNTELIDVMGSEFYRQAPKSYSELVK